MQKLKSSFLLIIFVVVLGCSFNSSLADSQKERLLKQHLQKWQQFTADGIVEVNYKNFVFRKNINIQKAASNWKLAIYDSGIFGMKPEPFLLVTIDSLIVVKSQTESEKIYQIEQYPGLEFFLKPDLLLKYSDEILKGEILRLSNGITISFSNLMQIEKIEQKTTGKKIELKYLDELSSIQIFEENKLLVKIEIDKISWLND